MTTAWALALERPCPDHGAAPGEPCWCCDVTGICGNRIALAGLTSGEGAAW